MTASQIRLATDSDVAAITALLQSCAQSMSDQGMHHWLGVYDEDSVKANLSGKKVFVLESDNAILGCIALGTEKAEYYSACWPQAPQADFYITQLAVSPEAQGKGYGKQLMQYCISRAGDAVIQLDAVAHYPALIAFYQSLGFSIIETGIGLGDKRHLFSLSR
jgi:ribosomal protein S18 acetylase RimI-like enzyme